MGLVAVLAHVMMRVGFLVFCLMFVHIVAAQASFIRFSHVASCGIFPFIPCALENNCPEKTKNPKNKKFSSPFSALGRVLPSYVREQGRENK
jgi:hypothetical protein